MPELPEVETVCRGLRRADFEAPVRSVWRSSLDLRIGSYWARVNEGSAKLKGRLPGKISRRGKYILWSFEDPQQGAPLTMVLHLGMSGAVEIRRKGEKKTAHTHLQIIFADDRRVDYVDPRRFGGFRVDQWSAHSKGPLGKLGPEPLSDAFDGAALYGALSRRKVAIRDALLNQSIVAGVGNIYAVEALFVCGIDPQRSANSLTRAQCDLLAKTIRKGLVRAIELGGTTLRDYRGADGEKGKHQQELGVYGREGQSCPRCKASIERVLLGGRSAFFCRACQR